MAGRGRDIYAITFAIRTHMTGDTQELEGMNSLIRIGCTTARRISLPLLSARVGTKKALGVGARGVSPKFSVTAPRAEAIIKECIEVSIDDAQAAMMDETRWSQLSHIEGPSPSVLKAASVVSKGSGRRGGDATAEEEGEFDEEEGEYDMEGGR